MIVAVSARLGDKDADVRAAASTALAQLAEKNNAVGVIPAVSARLKDEDEDTRSTAARVLLQLAEKANEYDMLDIGVLSRSHDADFRAAVRKALAF